MSTNDTIRDVRHVKAARELLRWNQERLAEVTGLSLASIRRYEAARERIADYIERDIVEALEQAGIVFVAEGEIADATVSGGVLLRTSADPDGPSTAKLYVYGPEKKPGRPEGTRDASPRKRRASVKGPEQD